MIDRDVVVVLEPKENQFEECFIDLVDVDSWYTGKQYESWNY